MSLDDQEWLTLHSRFPVTIDSSETDPTQLKDGFSPLSYGLAIDTYGRLAKASSVPTGEAIIKKTYTISGNVWTWYFNRCWRISGANMLSNAKQYTAVVMAQGPELGLNFDEDAEDIVEFLPMGGGMYVGKTTGGYVIPNATGSSREFMHGDIVPSMKIATANNAVSLGGVVYVSNSDGLMAWDGREPVELTAPMRDLVSTYFADMALTVDPQRMLVVGTDGTNGFAYDTRTKRMFLYNSTDFRFTSRTLYMDDGIPFSVQEIMLRYEYDGKKSLKINYQIERSEGWERTQSLTIRPAESNRKSMQVFRFSEFPNARKWRIRFLDFPDNFGIREIAVKVDASQGRGGFSQ